ncbi:helix-turn-helix transcriptional regulator [Lentilactobacillus kisonensis]|uniref:DNA-binding helix-turn-helix protein n=1 Tax=Lentilactobacillus kisonensis DSM 19906 = JCM 15041 TaxID=1423766 RepID=A0A0R1NJ75_9LACO|nr:helix-turn-helix transcriptional regulator [Lentilactobacillus kisonensis]KRL20326.1 DNA-binding helix-turn-helix protein [Lentilactobacillus kisonensis DSM 19906 = JCM 15041]
MATKDQIIIELNDLNHVIASYPVDSKQYQNASDKLSRLLLDAVNIRDVSFIVKALGRKLSDDELANLIIAGRNGQPLNESVTLPAEADAAYTLRIERQKRHLTQQELASKIGITQGQLAKIENGQQNANLNLLQRAMSVFGEPYIVKPIPQS